MGFKHIKHIITVCEQKFCTAGDSIKNMGKGISQKLSEQRKQLADEVAKGKSLNEVAKDHQCSISLVSKACREYGVQTPFTKLRLSVEEVVSIIWRLQHTDDTLATIASDMRLPNQSVSHVHQHAVKGGLIFTHRTKGRPRKA